MITSGNWTTPRGTTLRWAAVTDVGKVRRLNEDSCLARHDAFVVADGMGGHRAGDVASRLTIEAVESMLTGDGVTVDVLPAIVAAANARVRDESLVSSREGMGSTLVGAFLVDNGGDEEIAVVNVGDSRCYRLGEGRVTQVSRDHSYVQELVDAGTISATQARSHREKNVITRAIGIDATVTADYYFLPSDSDYRFMLCSDGLSGEVDDAEIELLLQSSESPEAAAETLLAAALRGDAGDNITVIVVDVGGRQRNEGAASPADDTLTVRRTADAEVTLPTRRSKDPVVVDELIVVPSGATTDGSSPASKDSGDVIEVVPVTTAVGEADATPASSTPGVLIDVVPEVQG